MYDVVRTLLRTAPLIIAIAALALPIRRKRFRYIIAFFATWAAVFVFTQLYWDYSIASARSWEERADLAARDGGARAGSLYLGWLHAIMALALLEPLFVIVRWLSARDRVTSRTDD